MICHAQLVAIDLPRGIMRIYLAIMPTFQPLTAEKPSVLNVLDGWFLSPKLSLVIVVAGLFCLPAGRQGLQCQQKDCGSFWFSFGRLVGSGC